MLIRDEAQGDASAIHALTARAFSAMPFSDGSEPAIVAALRAQGELSLSLVATDGEQLVGQITFSPVTVDGVHDGWFGLGPVSVQPDRQRSGIGSALIRAGLERLEAMNAKACVLVGNPDYYSRFGFEANVGLIYGDVPAEYIQRLVLAGTAKRGTLQYSPAFELAAAGG